MYALESRGAGFRGGAFAVGCAHARRAAREAAHIARCKELDIDPQRRGARFYAMKVRLGE